MTIAFKWFIKTYLIEGKVNVKSVDKDDILSFMKQEQPVQINIFHAWYELMHWGKAVYWYKLWLKVIKGFFFITTGLNNFFVTLYMYVTYIFENREDHGFVKRLVKCKIMFRDLVIRLPLSTST